MRDNCSVLQKFCEKTTLFDDTTVYGQYNRFAMQRLFLQTICMISNFFAEVLRDKSSFKLLRDNRFSFVKAVRDNCFFFAKVLRENRSIFAKIFRENRSFAKFCERTVLCLQKFCKKTVFFCKNFAR